MRIIAGKYKGKVLNQFSLNKTRPTTDLVREALFDKIGLDVMDAVFLDLFAGTGACGIEALSRGAKFCYFVDAENEAAKLVKKNINLVGAENCEVINTGYEKALNNFEKQSIIFDFVFLDPPYKSDFAEKAIDILKMNNLLSKQSMIIWEHDSSKLDYVKNKFVDCKIKKYGQKYLTYIKFDC